MGGATEDEPHLELTPSFELLVPKPKASKKKGQLGLGTSSKQPDLVSIVFVPELRAMFSGRCAP